MVNVTFTIEKETIGVEEGTTILEAARRAGVVVESPCNGTGVCGKCKVKLPESFRKNIETGGRHRLPAEEELEGYVLACEAKIYGDILVETTGSRRDMKILSHGNLFDITMESFISKVFDSKEAVTKVYGGEALLGEEAGDTSLQEYGVVVDIGTTTLVASLVDLNTGKELDSVSELNPQAVHAQDVLSRIKLASEDEGLELMYSEFRAEANRMLETLALRNSVDRNHIYEVIYSGNTTMLHLACRVNPYSLGKFPYTPVISGAMHMKAQEVGLEISPFGLVYLPPIISTYVGADITSGVLASRLPELEGVTLFVDIGTNGEMVIAKNGKLSATSTAAGPAFEGMNITHGMRAGPGAVELFNIEDDGRITVRTIGDEPARGICGSGLLDIVGELVASGVILKNGKFVKPDDPGIPPVLRERLSIAEGKPVFKVAEGVILTQKDVRQVQLAKGAVRAGIEFLMRSREVGPSQVDRVLIAGSFGYHLRAKSLINLGLLPAEFENKVEFIGNTSKSGGYAFLLNHSYRSRMAETVNQVDVVELANYKDFDRVFVDCLNF